MTIKVQYSCDACGIENREVSIRYRESDEPILAWMEIVIASLGFDHHSQSPHCHPELLSRIKIPVPDGSQQIGGPSLS